MHFIFRDNILFVFRDFFFLSLFYARCFFLLEYNTNILVWFGNFLKDFLRIIFYHISGRFILSSLFFFYFMSVYFYLKYFKNYCCFFNVLQFLFLWVYCFWYTKIASVITNLKVWKIFCISNFKLFIFDLRFTSLTIIILGDNLG